MLHKHLPGVEVWAYGSRVNGRSHDGSDLDLVLRSPKLAEIDISRLADFIEALQDSTIPFLVEARDWARLPESFYHEIEREHVVLVVGYQDGGPKRKPSSSMRISPLISKSLDMASDWPIMSLREAGVSLIDCEHRTPPASEYGYPYVAIPQVKDGRINLDGVRRITREHFDEWTRKAAPESFDIVLSRRCNPGETGFVSEGLKFALGQNLVLLRSNGTKVFKPFLRWLVRGPQWWEQVGAYINVGAVFDSLKCADIPGFRLLIPFLPEQRAIAHILGTLDDKIELNRRMNETLEAMARALFKSWFVDFDPVRAKMEGRDPGLPRHLVELFPDRLVESELGKIPEGWEVTPFSECVEFERGLSYKGSRLSSDGVPMHNLNSIYEGGGYKHDGLKGYDGEHKSQHVARAGDLIVANTEQGHDRLLIGYAAIVPTYFVNETLFSHHIYRVRPKDCMVLTSNYLCQLLNSRFMHEIVSGFANGTTVNMLPMDALQIPQIVVPARRVLAAFNDLAETARRRQEEMSDEFRTLAALRDALLPNLISGKLRVRGAKRFIGRSA